MKPTNPSLPSPPAEERMLLLASYQEFEEAEYLLSLLSRHGVRAYLRNEFSNRMLSPMVDIGGYRVEIAELDVEKALQILEEEGYSLPDETESNIGTIASLADKLPFFRKKNLEFRLWALLLSTILFLALLALTLYLITSFAG
ncbi:putative signal transducing protein [Porphyromonas crevioricanis]|uniref:DUF2007 domain-containing protein n=2 Tax=Porphyromonas crevioricanis TaxID=393921 RepID=A0A2X4PKP7_9PORP|nr:DUF2007 domain-containing protein [Porphyromonas crevioricanis]GAD07062.1 hypothetical protein PORCAN_676 [Porphyromonas crevioricanis JCM 13913]SQH72333.1 Uncharacterised protein [Porphyromonas crevioricanis]